jgi:hypothetical protein
MWIKPKMGEPVNAWFSRVGWQKMGFRSKDQWQASLEFLQAKGMVRGVLTLPPERLKLIHHLLTQKGEAHDVGVDLIDRVRDPKQMEEFVPDVKALHQPGRRNAQFKAVLERWYYLGGKPLIKRLTKDPDPTVAADAAHILDENENGPTKLLNDPGQGGSAALAAESLGSSMWPVCGRSVGEGWCRSTARLPISDGSVTAPSRSFRPIDLIGTAL